MSEHCHFALLLVLYLASPSVGSNGEWARVALGAHPNLKYHVTIKSADSTMACSFHTVLSLVPTSALANGRSVYDRNGRDADPKFHMTSSHSYVINYAQKTNKLGDSHQTPFPFAWRVGSGHETSHARAHITCNYIYMT